MGSPGAWNAFLACAFVAEVMGTMAGFGAATILTPIAAFFMDMKTARLPHTPATLIGGGALSGFVAGLLGTGGAIRSACLLVFGLPKEVYIGTSAAIALIVDATRLPVYLAGGFLPSRMVPVLLGLMAVAFTGAWVGQQLVRRVSATVFQRLVLTMLALMGVKLLVDGWRGLL